MGLDIEWEVGAAGPPAGIVHGDVLVGRDRFAVDGPGRFFDDGDPDPPAVDGETVATVYVPVGGPGEHVEARLVRPDGAPSGDRGWVFDRNPKSRDRGAVPS